MKAVVLSEKVNLEAVKYLITKPKAWSVKPRAFLS